MKKRWPKRYLRPSLINGQKCTYAQSLLYLHMPSTIPFVKFHLRKHEELCIVKMTGGVKISSSETHPSFSAFVELHNNVSIMLNRRLIGIFTIWFLRLDYGDKNLGWQLLSKEIATEKWRFASWGMWKIKDLLTFRSLQRNDRTMQKPLSNRTPEISQPLSYPAPVRLRVRKCRVLTVGCVMGHKADHIEFHTLTISLLFLANTSTCSFTFLLNYSQIALAKIFQKNRNSPQIGTYYEKLELKD